MRHLRAFHALALLGAVASAALVIALLVLTAQMDRQQRMRDVGLVSSQIDTTMEMAKNSVVAYARSDEAIRRLDRGRDEAWARATFVNSVDSTVWSYTFAYDNRIISRPDLVSRRPLGALAIEASLVASVERIRKLSMSPATSHQVDLAAGVTETLRVSDEFFCLLVARFEAETPSLKLIHDEPPLLAIVTPASELLRIGLAGDGIDKPSIVDPKVAVGSPSKALTDALGGTVGAVVWTSRRPGADLMAVILVPLIALVVIFLALVAYAHRHGVIVAGELLASEARARQIAHQDQLTGLANRRHFIEELNKAFKRGEEAEAKPALILIDLDRFKAVNDMFGHQCGDELIREAGRRLSSACRTNDLCARLGGDEFIVLIRDCEAADAVRLARRLLEALTGRVQLPLASIQVGGSAGVSSFSKQKSWEDFMREADLALYNAKDHCRGSLRVFEPSMASVGRGCPPCDPIQQNRPNDLAHWREPYGTEPANEKVSLALEEQVRLAEGQP